MSYMDRLRARIAVWLVADVAARISSGAVLALSVNVAVEYAKRLEELADK
jgi:hypothetical protein